MVATRNHPKDFDSPAATPAPEPSPRKRSTRTSTTTTTSTATTASADNSSPSKPTITPSSPSSSIMTSPTRSRAPRTTSSRSKPGWSHTPSNTTLIWLAISLPLVTWDTGYVLLRPYSMPGGALHAPIWKPYDLYGRVDYTYGWKAYDAQSGWTAAQGTLNLLETVAYGVYLWLVYTYGEQEATQGTGAVDKEKLEGMDGRLRWLSESRTVYGRVAGVATVLAFTTAQITFWKTVLYWLIELYSGFDNIGHNSFLNLFWLWIVPNGAWLVLPAYMMYVFGREILQGLDVAASPSSSAKRQ